MSLFGRMILAALTMSIATACNPKSVSQMKDESLAPLSEWDWLNIWATDPDPDAAAAILGLAPDRPSAGQCTQCHQDFYDESRQSELQSRAARAASCLRENIRTREGAVKALSCLGGYSFEDPAKQEAAIRSLNTRKLGVLAAGLNSKTIQRLFVDAGYSELGERLAKTDSMPLGLPKLTDDQFELMFRWLAQGMPQREKYFHHRGPQVCSDQSETFIGEKIKSHIKQMVNGQGWSAVNSSRGVINFGCADGQCFQDQLRGEDVFPKVTGILTAEGEARRIYEIKDDATNFWVRSSADGRFLAYGIRSKDSEREGGEGQDLEDTQDEVEKVHFNGRMIDLAPMLKGGKARAIQLAADFDPAFAPDNSSFMMQSLYTGTRFCSQRLLERLDVESIDFEREKLCSKMGLGIGLYQSIGSNLGTSDIMTLNSDFIGDAGKERNHDSAPIFRQNDDVDFSLIHKSSLGDFQRIGEATIATPFEGNWTLSPSQKLAVSTVSAATSDFKPRHGGYHVVLLPDVVTDLEAFPSGKDEASSNLCIERGEKPNFSLDDRYLVYYAYESHDGQKKVLDSESSSDIYVIDLLSDGKAQRLTRVPKGSYAQFPHFRSDGWIYFSLLNTLSGTHEIIATDAALRLKH
jgi:hypothetical protein